MAYYLLHIDCNNFYASCEVAHKPDLKGRPVVVANYNEAGGGVILALSKEAKALGLKRGNPVFQVKSLIERCGVTMFHTHMEKYAEISNMIMQAVVEQGIVLDFTKYSIDEFFGMIPVGDKDELLLYINKVKEHIRCVADIPVSCGASLTNTLAKVATWYAKHYYGYNGICVLRKESIETALKGVPVSDVWGIGRRSVPKMKKFGIVTAWDFVQKPEGFIKNQFGVNGYRTWMELHGTQCIDLSTPVQQRTIMYSRTFDYMTSDHDDMQSYIRSFAVAAARKLRKQRSVCGVVLVFIRTNRHRDDLEQYGNSMSVRLPNKSADTTTITKAALRALEDVYKPYYMYKQAGVVLADIAGDGAIEQDLFAVSGDNPQKRISLMKAMDNINLRYGKDKVGLASLIKDKKGK